MFYTVSSQTTPSFRHSPNQAAHGQTPKKILDLPIFEEKGLTKSTSEHTVY
jgi:hypothetical protein